MRSATTDMKTSLHQEQTSLCLCWKFTRNDGRILRFTDLDRDVVVGGETFSANVGIVTSAIVCSATRFSSQTTQVDMPLTPTGMSEADVRNRKWHGATALLSLVDYENPTSALNIFSGNFGRITINERGIATIEVLSLGNTDTNLASDVYSMTCRNSLGDNKCLVNIEALRVDFTVVTVEDDFTIIVDRLPAPSDGWFAFGQLVWDTGDNVGEASEVQTSLLTNEIGLFYPPTNVIQIGDTGHVYPGCDLLITTCDGKFSNAVNFNGEPFNVQPGVAPAPASSMNSVPRPSTGGGYLPT